MDARDFSAGSSGQRVSTDSTSGSNRTSKGGKNNDNILEKILIGICYIAFALGFFVGIPSFLYAINAILGNRFANFILTASPLVITLIKWLTLFGLVSLVIFVWKSKKIPLIGRFVAIAGLSVVIKVIMFADDPSAVLAILGLINLVMAFFLWLIVNGVQLYVLIKRKKGFIPRGEKQLSAWKFVTFASVVAYMFEISLNLIYNPLFAPLRDLFDLGQFATSLFTGAWLNSLAVAIFQLCGMVLSVLVAEYTVMMIFALKNIEPDI